MVRSSLCPALQTQQEAEVWMESFFDLCDKDPTSYETHCNAGGKNEIWDLYVVEKRIRTQTTWSTTTFWIYGIHYFQE